MRPQSGFDILSALCVLLALCQAGCTQQVDYASADRGATITGPRNASGSRGRPNCAIDGSVEFGPSHGYAWAWMDAPTVVALADPAPINAIEVLFVDLGGRSFGYTLSVSADGQTWRQVADTSDAPVSGYRMHSFPTTSVSRIRLTVTRASAGLRSYQLAEIAAWRLDEDATAGPIGQRFAAREEALRQQRAALLGMETLQAELNRQHIADLIAALGQDEHISHSLEDGTKLLITRDAGHVLVIIDDDGDMPDDATGPDGDSDCIALDMDADGLLDRSIDYDDLDADGRADQMVQTYTVQSTWGRRPFLVIARDFDAGPLRLWSLHDYGYIQGLCQWDCDFGGDGWFAMFRRSGDGWVATFECPFCFYDHDGDALAEETVRLTAEGTTLRSARYSLNADNDETEGQLYDYDVSVTCLGAIEVPADAKETLTHRSGDRIGPLLSWKDTREVVRGADWERCLLIWDENDHNVAARKPDRERWEGILNAEWRGFPQEGGPPTLRDNKRFELDEDYSGGMRLYWWPADARLHLFGAEQGGLDVDYDYDGTIDLHIEYADTDEDGFFDRRTISYPGTHLPDRRLDGPRDYSVPGAAGDTTTLPLDYEAVAPFWSDELAARSQAAADLLDALQAFAHRLELPLRRGPLNFYETAAESDFPYITRLRDSAEARRYYREVALEVAFAHLVADARSAGLPSVETGRLVAARERCDVGDLRAAHRLLLTDRDGR